MDLSMHSVVRSWGIRSIHSDGEVRILSRQGGGHVTRHDNNLVCKSGSRVRYSEEVAIRLVKQYTSVPVPIIIFSNYEPEKGNIGVSFVPGLTLKSI